MRRVSHYALESIFLGSYNGVIVNNDRLAKIFLEMAELLEMREVPFKPRAFEKASRAISSLGDDVGKMYKDGGLKALEKIPGIGKGIAGRIEEFLQRGTIKEYQELKKEMPVDVAGLTAIEGVGPRLIQLLYKKLRITNVSQLEKAARAGKLRVLPRVGEKLESKILRSIAFHRRTIGRFLLGDVLPLARAIETHLRAVKGVREVMLAGSARRWQETVGDLDFLAIAKKPEDVTAAFTRFPEVRHVYSRGKTKSAVRLAAGIDADLRVVKPESFGTALQYFTGDKSHNIAVRAIAAQKGYKLNEYGLYKGKRLVAGREEKEIYEMLGLSWMPPEMRLNIGELDLAKKRRIPRLVELHDIKGDLQVQTDWTDGENSIEEMARAARLLGLSYIAITDHTKGLAMTGGADEKKLQRQMNAIDRLNKKNLGIAVLAGAEVNITKDGGLDIADTMLEKLDVVGAAVHSHFRLSKKEQTERVIRAMSNPHVDIIFHPTGRLIHAREPIELDMEEIFQAAKHTNTLLEIDAFPSRLDLRDEHIRAAREFGVRFVVDTDAHAAPQLSLMEYGIGQARRGWCEKKHIINTLPLEKFLALMRTPKAKRKF